MKANLKPLLSDTQTSPEAIQWAPSSFKNLLIELEHIKKNCEGNQILPLYRGQADYQWPLDSSFLRNSINTLFNITDYYILADNIRQTIEFNKMLYSLLFVKYGIIANPHKELYNLEEKQNIDPWFELLKYNQQYPENDLFHIKGTFILDWTTDFLVALYFANEDKDKRGGVWIYDSVSTGKTLQIKKISDIMELMKSDEQVNNPKNLPLIFHPPKQTDQHRAKNQKAVYISQMDFRYNLADVWYNYGLNINNKVVIQLILPFDSHDEVDIYLKEKGYTYYHIYPDKENRFNDMAKQKSL